MHRWESWSRYRQMSINAMEHDHEMNEVGTGRLMKWLMPKIAHASREATMSGAMAYACPVGSDLLLPPSSHTFVGESQPGERRPIKGVPAVDDDGARHEFVDGDPVEVEELLPLGHQHAGVRALERLQG